MRQIRTSAAAVIVGLGALALLAAPSFAASDQSATKAGAPVQLAHMGQDQGSQWRGQPCPMGKMGPGMMAPGMPDQGMMVPQGMMGPGFGKGPDLGSQVVPSKDLTADDVRHFLEHRLEMHGNKRLKVSEVKEIDDDTIVAEIVTLEDSLVQRLKIDRHSGATHQVD